MTGSRTTFNRSREMNSSPTSGRVKIFQPRTAREQYTIYNHEDALSIQIDRYCEFGLYYCVHITYI
jgi:hypothetical protein